MLVRWTKPATDDLTSICDYSEERFGIAQARRAALTIHDAADSLREMPFLGRTGLPMLIVYRVGKEAVEIVRILHGARQWP
jgi:plasmid stabilization system protein ParE